ncbi:spermidine synthase [Lacipirellula sp.]|uniref:spermidine synthase n=1 Tax=Lacipirellula sp. TaxID=2691419 RepID=UPI003D14EEDE
MNSDAAVPALDNAAPPAVAPSPAIDFALAATAALSAWLIFQVQPMVAKRILPWFGGGTAVWTTVMLFFQAALFFGYLYAHLATKWFTPRRQVHLHVALLAAAAMLAAIVGVLPSDEWRPDGSGLPALHILVMLSAAVGLPYLALSATAPLTQVWFARIHPGRSPYRLYALSNAGSLAALLSYPFLVEPNLGVSTQGVSWSALFVAFALLCAWSALASLRFRNHVVASSTADSSDAALSRSGALQRFFWLALPATASAALLAITTYLCQDVPSVPLLWIAPMVVYLLSFILTFDSDRWYRRDVWFSIGAIASFAAVISWFQKDAVPLSTMLGVHLALLAAICMVCHGELVRRRPVASRLTAFYLSIAAGGAIGGLLVGVVAPLVLSDYYELQLSMLSAWGLALFAIITDPASPHFDGGKRGRYAGTLGMAGLFVLLVICVGVNVAKLREGVLQRGRNFYGVLTVRHMNQGSPDEFVELSNGRTTHGGQFIAEANRRVPMWYYHADSGVGILMRETASDSPRRVGIIGLGVGTLAAYAEPGETFRFYDVNPLVLDWAVNFFKYLREASERGATIDLIEGDARIAMENEPPQNFDVLVLDAFNGDSIPAHLLTLEAFELYLKHLKEPDGFLAVHVSSLHLDLVPVVKAAAEKFNLHGAIIEVPPDDTPAGAGCTWVLLSRQPNPFADLDVAIPFGEGAGAVPSVIWTDDYSSLLDVLKD